MFDNKNLNGNSVIHGLDSRVKILVIGAFSIVMAVCSNWFALWLGFFVVICMMLLSRMPLMETVTRLILLNGLMLFLWFFLPFSFEGEPVFTFGPLIATKQGISFAALLSVRSNIILLAGLCLVSTTSIFSLGYAMRKLRFPGKAVQLFFFTHRYLDVMHKEYQRLVNALKIRGFQPKTSVHTYRTYAYLIGMLLVKSYDRSERIRNAMVCRGFKGRFYDLSESSLKPSDYIALVLMSLALGVVSLLQWTEIIY